MTSSPQQAIGPDDYIDTTAIFSEVKRNVFSRNFGGGRVYNIFGATKLDFTTADINGTIIVDITQVCGETKIRVPNDWFIRIDHTAILAEMKDRRNDPPKINDVNKMLLIRGFSLLGTVIIKNAIG